MQKLEINVQTRDDMIQLGKRIAHTLRGRDVVLLSGPLGAGKTTLAKGIGEGMRIAEDIVSPTFTISRELQGVLQGGSKARLIHVDAYRIGGALLSDVENIDTLILDQLESLGLDEEIEEPSQNTVVLMEWGERFVTSLAPQRLEIYISRPLSNTANSEQTLSDEGTRIVTIVPVGESWQKRELAQE
ncbi:MAG: tRNA (adenosine(37)-N6)-threonylcarbamoyltransferase complex ATPase subunit type 1 TsaE [Bifidobacteriaceae bacterium]|nr:tRNA (adenosine(37)-N6)-threonylcarbamoyltransferase complex ATPase subunit type 1 TsaE [Bifidobacteriaceae bacterium]